MKQKILKILLFASFICAAIGILFYCSKRNNNFIAITNSAKTNIQSIIENTKDLNPLNTKKEIKNENFNILILGKGGEKHQSGYLTDTIIAANFQISSSENKITLISIPRDLFVKANSQDSSSYYTKINAVEAINKENGVEEIKNTIYEITGLPMQNYVEIDFEAFKQTIDTLGCISVYVEKDIYDPLFPGANFSYEPFSINKGWHCMDGETSLKYVRSRHSAFGDLDRIKRQQQIIEAIKINLLSPKTLFNLKKLLKLLETLKKNISTDLDISGIQKLYEAAQRTKPEQIINISIDNSNTQLIQNYQNESAGSVLLPSEGLGNYDKIKEYIKQKIFNY